MSDKFIYLLVDVACLIVPLAFSFHPRINFYRQWKPFAISCLATSSFFLVWDIFFTQMGVWSFSHTYTIGVYFLRLPLEEYLFFITIPYACMFTYYSIIVFSNLSFLQKVSRQFSWILMVFLMVIAFLHMARLYTSVTFGLLSACLLILLMKKVSFLPYFYLMFSIILLPFCISNGILTGTGLTSPVVVYNNHYNLGLRIVTIPVEDIFYAMLLLLMNVAIFEWLKTKVFVDNQLAGKS